MTHKYQCLSAILRKVSFSNEIWAISLKCVTRVCLPESDALVVDVGFADDF